ncbi:serS [Wigglesworthia glossinidia endosymbiont of Glossina brevipalpis]|uniref:Serine--tRNA ligase n=1 Tax=Wigglesworthia glossinidia brevipalpis TaxID=36870 RepID=SYS_WIGBR|nr:RecName: Full=Serine--tRNA ligase; AltName: Full=Seryl-tRNA synthetase; Short=SerRS; AltName: Full=Seryl-tRNA(Ser/Sec) synthetase [Wigglesworthia glossinidia endosymbiont of Glossina brevipalpis]BAC24635.1 serS [Wigglesworthia glossinidia endosymbiont of Glossina brevipalpis]
MIDHKLIIKNIEEVCKKLILRNFYLDKKKILLQDQKRKILQIEVEKLQNKRNLQSKIISKIKINNKNIDIYKNKSNKINILLNEKKQKLKKIKKEIDNYLSTIPNILDEKVPIGKDQKNNIEVKKWGSPKIYNFKIKSHVEIGEKIKYLDFSRSAKISGSRFVVMKNKISYMHRALSQFMLNLHTNQHGYEEYYVPYLVNKNMLYGTGQLPKFYNDFFYAKSFFEDIQSCYALIPTAEVPLTNLMRNEIIDENYLPIKMTSHTPCFRSEAGSYGKDTKGLIRMHQFDKVEIVQIVSPENSIKALEEITHHAERVLQLLDLPYRKILLCSGDTGFSSCKTYDLEVWMPSRNKYIEVSSCSNTSDFQSRRTKIRYRKISNKEIHLTHILNGSALAISRTLASIIENYQTKEGNIKVPKILQPYMDGLKLIK